MRSDDDIFDIAISFIIHDLEGGYVNDPHDPGGETKYGISKRSYPNLDIKSLSMDQAKAIYKRDYWDKMKLDKIPIPLNIVMLDTAINCGISTAFRLYSHADNWRDYLFSRLSYYTNLSTYKLYGRGWCNRIILLHSFCKNMEDY